MAYSIGEVEQLTGIKSHVLRYWEEVIPCFAPQKDAGGRRVYSRREVDLIRRIHFLIQVQGYTIEGASRRLIAEAVSARTEERTQALQAVRQVRARLNDACLAMHRRRAARPSEEREHETEQEA